MSKLKSLPSPVNGYDVSALTCWLEEQALRGLRFSFSLGMLTQFEQISPTRLRCHLEPVQKGTDQEERELKELFEQEGWQFLGKFRGAFYVFSSEDPQFQAHSDPDTYSRALDALARTVRWKIAGALLLLALLGYLIREDFSYLSPRFDLFPSPLFTLTTHSLSFWMLPLFAAGVFLIISLLRGLSALSALSFRIREDRPAPSDAKLRGGLWLKLCWLCLALIPVFWAFQTHGNDPVPLEQFAQTTGYVLLQDIESSPGFSKGGTINGYDYVRSSKHLLIPQKYYSREYGDYNIRKETTKLENGTTITSYSNFRYYLETHFLRCLTKGIADTLLNEQRHWAYFSQGTEVDHPDFDRLILYKEQKGTAIPFDISISVDGHMVENTAQPEPGELTRWYVYAQKGSSLLFVDYRGGEDLTEFLPRFARMLETL